ncbi:MAG: ABC transporter ATP-binding protein [Rhodothermaceae bacterium]|nr:ABC transporter ATP-binding protein [Rhodothermaceae bacterium]MXX58333.1 ABC transporter ATP-binding protein [Rhodothermaceae bacterium]MYD19011.1 ABC transporter ATP-binding protein [Rhodothermaceae bacterium]MYD55405.1 ABC transporter ATP-binding protein [Rhodothermaceae bacterium]MYI43400.1 ABC transporter ATP-binding protein [Rhodothermaceae bacterium]
MSKLNNKTHVEFKGVSKSYDGRTVVVKDLDLSIRTGEFVTLLGPSGSGKTTILMMLAGFQTPTAGEILLDGQPIHNMPARKRGIGMVFQNYALFPHMTVGANLAFPLEVRRMGTEERSERVERVLRLVRLEGFADRKPSQLSGGQQQRVAIARALVFEPSLVLMDEPLGALDRSLRDEMQYEIRRIHRTLGVTVVYVTHDQQEAMVMSDRIAVLRKGIVEQIAMPEGLYEEPTSSFVASFIGESNQLHGRILGMSEEDNVYEVETGGEMIHALKVEPCNVGDDVTLSIRPERVKINPEAGRYTNEVDATVEDLTFLGNQLRVRLATCGREDFIATIPNIVGHGGWITGDSVRLGWTTVDCRALNHEQFSD